MSQENVEVVRRVVKAFNRQDWATWNSLYHADAEWFDPPEVPGSGVHRGRRSIRQYFDELLEIAAEGFKIEVDALEDLGGDCVLIRGRTVLVARGSGIPIDAKVFQLVDLRDGRVRSVRNFRSGTEALEAAGLRE
jgi:ketosteroid isomerase-like protein